MTLHPTGKHGVRIEKRKYEAVRKTILGLLRKHGEMTFTAILQGARTKLKGKITGSATWYATVVKLDLEARNEIVCRRGSGAQRIRRGKARK